MKANSKIQKPTTFPKNKTPWFSHTTAIWETAAASNFFLQTPPRLFLPLSHIYLLLFPPLSFQVSPLSITKMRMSCNGCRVLRKGCSESCSIRPCLQWIKTPESQANATVFLAKFYGRAGLMNLINTGPEHLRPGKRNTNLYFFNYFFKSCSSYLICEF